jgi:hypothetical protein
MVLLSGDVMQLKAEGVSFAADNADGVSGT